MAFCGLLAATPVYADSEHDAKPAASRKDQDAMLRQRMRDSINTGLVGIVSEGTDYTVDLALTLAGEQNHLRLLPIAGTGARQNAMDVVFARGIDFGVVQTDVLEEIKRNPPFSGRRKVPAIRHEALRLRPSYPGRTRHPVDRRFEREKGQFRAA